MALEDHKSCRTRTGILPGRPAAAYRTAYQNEAGFTLVELAIVLMIIGLLIGGILRGQELMRNAQVTSQIQFFKAYTGATVTFMDMYQGLPGDMLFPSARIPNCTTLPCNRPGNGNSMIGPVASAEGFSYSTASENNTYFAQLAAAHLVSGVDVSSDWGTSAQGAYYPMTPMGALMWIAYYNHFPQAGSLYTSAIQGHWFVLVGRNPSGAGFTRNAVPINRLALLDKKMDDGLPWNGEAVINSGGCNHPGSEYDMNNVTPCTFMVRAGF